MKVIIAGGRDFNDYVLLVKVCDFMLQNQKSEDIEIVSGTAKGADILGEKYAKERNLKITYFPADWSLGKQAGFLRNKQMADYADAAICFWDGVSKGTHHMINLTTERGLKLKIQKY